MQIFIGSPALSSFRQDKLHKQIQMLIPTISQITSHFVHFVDEDTTLSDDETSVLEKLLRYGPHMAETSSEGELFLVVQRTGTISPW